MTQSDREAIKRQWKRKPVTVIHTVTLVTDEIGDNIWKKPIKRRWGHYIYKKKNKKKNNRLFHFHVFIARQTHII